jgi:hypothetical protein
MTGYVLLLTIAALAASGGCASGVPEVAQAVPQQTAHVPQQTLQLKVGESAPVEAASVLIGFEAVPSDSRCPRGEACIWEGDATVQIWVQRADGTKEQRELHTAARKPHAVGYPGFSIRLVSLTPFPFSGRAISPADYRVTLEFSEGAPPSEDEIL